MIFRAIAATAVILFACSANAIDASNRYRSPRNPERKVRATTELIVLHTTEAPAKSSLDKLSDRGECHFCVTEDGSVYRIIDRDKVAFHAGRSMWNGKEDVDEFSIGIECIGYHDKEMGIVQLRAIRDLVKELQSMYRIPDERVVCHGHVAYGAPNKWHRFKHRGRKRCGMLFAMASVRKVLQLSKRPARDPDVVAKRLQNADDYLRKVLYGNVDTMKSAYANVTAPPPSTSSSGIFSWLGFGKSGQNAKPVVQPKPQAKPQPRPQPKPQPRQQVQSQPKPQPKPPALTPPKPVFKTLPRNTAELRELGYVAKGSVTKEQTAAKIAGARWNASDTYYVIRNKVIPGNTIDPAHIELGMTIWMKK